MLTEKELLEIRTKSRNSVKFRDRVPDPDYKTPMELKEPVPPLVKDDMTTAAFDLPRNFEDLDTKVDFTTVLKERKSNRVYTDQAITLLQLSYLLWATQGIKALRGKRYATLRTVPSGGARHPFETYLIVKHVEGLEPGLYHYLPWGHRMEKLGEVEDMNKTITDSLVGQAWAAKSSVVFYWSYVPSRSEWKGGITGHGRIFGDMGHVGENLYLTANVLGLGTCGIGAYDIDLCNKLFGLDGDEEFVLYTQTIGTIRPDDVYKEDAIYQFVYDEGL